MRPSLLPGLLAAVQRNRNRGFADVALFEVGQAYRGDGPEDQFMVASGVRAGAASDWRAPAGIGRAAPRTPICSTSRPMSFALLAGLGLRCRASADHARCAGLVPSRPLAPA